MGRHMHDDVLVSACAYGVHDRSRIYQQRQWTWFETLGKMTFYRSSRKELMEFYPERAGPILYVKLFVLGFWFDARCAVGD